MEDKKAPFPKKLINQIIQTLENDRYEYSNNEGFNKAEVAKGGVSLSELNSKSLESKKVPGLYFIGEAVDTTGLLGGYNFQWAWSSAFVSAKNISISNIR